MLKFIGLSLFFAAVNAGLIGAPLGYSAPTIVAAPIAVKAHVPVASSYQNTYQISTGAVAVAAPIAPIIKTVAAPVAVASPLVHSVAASPYVHSYAAAPVLKAW